MHELFRGRSYFCVHENHRLKGKERGLSAVSHQHASFPSDAACAENHRYCSARVCSFDFCNYGTKLCTNAAAEITHLQKEYIYEKDTVLTQAALNDMNSD